MLAKVKSYTLEGLKGLQVDIETDVNSGLPSYETVGLPDTAVKESRERVRAAIKHSGFSYPTKRITVNLAPADSKKEGSLFDLAIAVSILAASEQLPYCSYKDIVFIGELSLDGSLRKVSGLMPIMISAMQDGNKVFVIPKDNEREASYVSGAQVYPMQSLAQVCAFVADKDKFSPIETRAFVPSAAVNK